MLPLLAGLARAKVAWASLNPNIYVEREYAWHVDGGWDDHPDLDNYYLLLRAKLTELAPMLRDHTKLTLVCCGNSHCLPPHTC